MSFNDALLDISNLQRSIKRTASIGESEITELTKELDASIEEFFDRVDTLNTLGLDDILPDDLHEIMILKEKCEAGTQNLRSMYQDFKDSMSLEDGISNESHSTDDNVGFDSFSIEGLGKQLMEEDSCFQEGEDMHGSGSVSRFKVTKSILLSAGLSVKSFDEALVQDLSN